MNRYQNWLDRKTHSQHLSNLLRIREGRSSNTVQKASSVHNESLSLKKPSYCRSQLLNRINSHYGQQNSIIHAAHFEKANTSGLTSSALGLTTPLQSQNNQMRTTNLNKFLRTKKSRIIYSLHELQFKLTVTYFSRLLRERPGSEVWMELSIGTEKAKSVPQPVSELLTKPFQFLFSKKSLAFPILLQFYYSYGLKCQQFGTYQIPLQIAEAKFCTDNFELTSTDGKFRMGLAVDCLPICKEDENTVRIDFS